MVILLPFFKVVVMLVLFQHPVVWHTLGTTPCTFSRMPPPKKRLLIVASQNDTNNHDNDNDDSGVICRVVSLWTQEEEKHTVPFCCKQNTITIMKVSAAISAFRHYCYCSKDHIAEPSLLVTSTRITTMHWWNKKKWQKQEDLTYYTLLFKHDGLLSTIKNTVRIKHIFLFLLLLLLSYYYIVQYTL
jgi:hypothetical protein